MFNGPEANNCFSIFFKGEYQELQNIGLKHKNKDVVVRVHASLKVHLLQARRRGGSRGSNEPPLEVNNGGLKTKTVDFQLLANSRGMENKL